MIAKPAYSCKGCGKPFKTWDACRTHLAGCLQHLTPEPAEHKSPDFTEAQKATRTLPRRRP